MILCVNTYRVKPGQRDALVADLVQDTRTLKVAQEEAKALLAVDPNLAMPQHRALSDEVDRLFATAGAMN